MSPACNTCSGTDHARRSSKKCKQYLPPIRKRNLSSTSREIEVYTVKHGLASLMCPLMPPERKLKLLAEIRRDVVDLSREYIGIWINYYMKTHSATLPDKPDILNFLYAMKGKGPHAEAYTKFFGPRVYDGKLRSFVVQEMAKQYETVLHTNISTHAYARLARYFGVKRNDPRLFDAFFKKRLPEDDDDEMLRICTLIKADTVKSSEWWSTVPEWIRIQTKLGDFRLLPQPSHGLKHITYISRGWHELLRRVDSASVTSDRKQITQHMQQLWTPWLQVIPAKFGCSIQTDGVSVSIFMNRTIKTKIFHS